jgi:hypothetical protein
VSRTHRVFKYQVGIMEWNGIVIGGLGVGRLVCYLNRNWCVVVFIYFSTWYVV